jgi:hypothetical protein
VHRVPVQTAPGLGNRARLPVALRWPRAVAKGFRECHDPTRR